MGHVRCLSAEALCWTGPGISWKKERNWLLEELEAAVEDISYQNGRFEVVGTSIGLGIFELAARQAEQLSFSTETVKILEERSWPNGCHIAEVEIDPETGSVRLIRHGTVDDTREFD